MDPVLDIFCIFILLLSFRRGYSQGLSKAWRQIWHLFTSLIVAWLARIPVGEFVLPFIEFDIPLLLGEVIGFVLVLFLSGTVLLALTWWLLPLEEVPQEDISRSNRLLAATLQLLKVCIFLVPSLLISEVSMAFTDPSLFSQLGPYSSVCTHRIASEIPMAEVRILEKGRFIVGAVHTVGSEEKKLLPFLGHPELLPIWEHPFVVELLQDSDFQEQHSKNRFSEMADHPKFMQVVQSTEIREIVANIDWEQIQLDLQSEESTQLPTTEQ